MPYRLPPYPPKANEKTENYKIDIKNRQKTSSGGRLNIKMPSYQYRDSHVKDKTVSPTVLSLTWESPYLGKMVFILRQGPVAYVRDYGQEALRAHQPISSNQREDMIA